MLSLVLIEIKTSRKSGCFAAIQFLGTWCLMRLHEDQICLSLTSNWAIIVSSKSIDFLLLVLIEIKTGVKGECFAAVQL
jgi:hypothetical protein